MLDLGFVCSMQHNPAFEVCSPLVIKLATADDVSFSSSCSFIRMTLSKPVRTILKAREKTTDVTL